MLLNSITVPTSKYLNESFERNIVPVVYYIATFLGILSFVLELKVSIQKLEPIKKKQTNLSAKMKSDCSFVSRKSSVAT